MLRRIYALFASILLIAGCSAQNLKPQGSWQLQRVEFPQQPPMFVQGSYSINFAEDKASGMLACNRWHSEFTFAMDYLKFIQPGTTRKACRTSLQGDLAAQYLHALELGGQWQNTAEKATFINRDGTLWYFIRH